MRLVSTEPVGELGLWAGDEPQASSGPQAAPQREVLRAADEAAREKEDAPEADAAEAEEEAAPEPPTARGKTTT